LTPNVADVATVTHVRTSDVRADTDNVTCRIDGLAGRIAQSRVEASGSIENQRLVTIRGVVIAVVEWERDGTGCRIADDGTAANKRIKTDSRVGIAIRAVERVETDAVFLVPSTFSTSVPVPIAVL